MAIIDDDCAIKDWQAERLSGFCLDHASVCALRLDRDGRILYANLKACDSLGYSQAELLKMSVFDIDPTMNREVWPRAWQIIGRDGSATIESLNRRKDGTTFPVEVTATLIQFEGRRYSMALIKDITEQKRIHDSLRTTQFVFDKAAVPIFVTRDGGPRSC